MKHIPLKCGLSFTIDDEDLKRVSMYKWCLSGNKHIMRYTKEKHPSAIYLHHFLIGKPSKSWQTDHIDRNPLNNCRNNLRNIPRWVNSVNRWTRPDNTSGKTGVYRKRNRWCARTYHGASLGSFVTKEQAIKARRDYENKIEF